SCLPSAVTLFCSSDTAPLQMFTLSLHDALPICHLYTSEELIFDFPGRSFSILQTNKYSKKEVQAAIPGGKANITARNFPDPVARSEEHTSELQSRENLVCRLLLEKNNSQINRDN